MKLLVTGGAGYIGTSLVPMLLEGGHEVKVLDRLIYGAEGLLPNFKNPHFELVVGDIRDESRVGECLKGMDAVVHLAALVGFPACRKDPWEAHSINVEGTSVLNKLREDRLLVYSSTGSNYGKVDGICTEETELRPLSVYGETKTEGEEVVRGENTIIYRFATAFGWSPKTRNDLLINNLTYQALKSKCLLLYEPENKRTFIHVNDMARAFVFALDNQDKMKGQIYNVGDEKGNMTKEEVVDILKSKLDFVYQVGTGWKDEDMRDYVVDYSKIKSLGYQAQISVEEGIDELIRIFRVIP